MEHRQLGRSGLRVPVLSFGAGTFGGRGPFFEKWGSTEPGEAQRIIDACIEAGVCFFDTSNTYSTGRSEEMLAAALGDRRKDVLISTKATFPMGEGARDFGSSRWSLVRECEASLRRLRTDYLDLYLMHGFDATTPVDETLRALDDLVQSGKVRYIGCSNFSGWHLMKSLAVSERYGWSRYAAHQVYYSLVGRELEWELMPLHLDQGVGSMVWSPLAGGSLTGKFRRGQPPPVSSRASRMDFVVSWKSERLHDVLDELERVAKEIGKTMAQVALRWVMQRPSVCNVVVGARTLEQLAENLGSLGWQLDDALVKRLDAVSDRTPVYPYWHQRGFPQLKSTLVF